MARTRATIWAHVWRDDDWTALTKDAQRLYLLLLSQPKLTLAGSLDLLPNRWVGFASDDTHEALGEALDDLSASRFIATDGDELVIRTFVANDLLAGTRNKNLLKGMWAAWAAIHSEKLRRVVVENIPEKVWEWEGVEPPAEATAMRPEPQSEPQSELWFEPGPKGRSGPVDTEKADDRDHSAPENTPEATGTGPDQAKRPNGNHGSNCGSNTGSNHLESGVWSLESGVSSPEPAGSATKTDPMARFDEFWDAYANKTNRKKCEGLWRKAMKDTDPQVVIDAAVAWRQAHVDADKVGFLCDPERWLRNRQWLDESLPAWLASRAGAGEKPGFLGDEARDQPTRVLTREEFLHGIG